MATDQELDSLGRCLLASAGAAQWPFVTMPPLRPSWPPAAALYDASPDEHAVARRAFFAAIPVSTAELAEKARLIAFNAFVSAQLDRFASGGAVDVAEARRWCDALLLATPEDFVGALTSDLPISAHQDDLRRRGPADAPVALVCYVLSKAPPPDRQALRRDTDRLRLAAP